MAFAVQRRVALKATLTAAALGSAVAAPISAGRTDLVVVGHLVEIAKSPDCGIFHFGSIAVYSDITVEVGAFDGSTLHVIHGCPELPRREYQPDSGDLERFREGDYHRLVLTDPAAFEGLVVETAGVEITPRYYCKHVELAKTSPRQGECSFAGSLPPTDVLIGYVGDIRATGDVRVGPFRALGILRNNALAASDGATIRDGMEFWQILKAAVPPAVLKNVSTFLDRVGEDHCVFHADLEDDLPLWTLLASRPLPNRMFRRPDVSDDIYFAEHHNVCVDQGDHEPSEKPPCSKPRLLAVSDLNDDSAAEYWATEPYLWDTGITVWQRTETGLSRILAVCTGCSD